MNLDLGDGYGVREFGEDDVSSIVEHANNPNVARNLEDRFPNPYTVEDAKEWLTRLGAQDVRTHFAITCDDRVIGGIGFHRRKDVYRGTAELGYWVGESFWGRGIATRAVRAVTIWAFENFDIVRMQARVFESNPASCRILEKMGFTFEGRLRQSVTKNGEVMDQLVYAALRDEIEALEQS